MPMLKEVQQTIEKSEEFLGYNHNLRIKSNEFYEMENLASDYYPLLSPREKRRNIITLSNDTTGMCNDTLAWVDGTQLCYNGTNYGLGLSTEASMCPKTIVKMGVYIYVFPDGKYLNTQTPYDYGDLANLWHSERLGYDHLLDSVVRIDACKLDGAKIEAIVSSTAPTTPVNGDYWYDSTNIPSILKQYSTNDKLWHTVPTTYLRISANGIATGFKEYDGVNIDGFTVDYMGNNYDALNTSTVIQKTGKIWFNDIEMPSSFKLDSAITENDILTAATDDTTKIVNGITKPDWKTVVTDYIVVVGSFEFSGKIQYGGVSVERNVPVMDYVTLGENRLWGCHYGLQKDKFVNEIYCCKLGDPFNWYCFMGIDSDSVVYTVGSNGPFTGAVTYRGYPLFFKENTLHKIYGSIPSNYQIVTTECRGVEDGSGKSLAIVNNVLFYKSRSGIMAYDGSTPDNISSIFGGIKYSDAVAGGKDNKYYVSMKDSSNVYHLFVYDTEKGLWHREDNTHVSGFCKDIYGNMYYVDSSTKELICTTDFLPYSTPTTSLEGDIKWFAESGMIGYDYERKYIAKLQIRMSLPLGSSLTVSIMYDSSGDWERVFTITGKNTRAFAIPLMPRRCDHFRIKLNGTGDCKVFGLTKILEAGSDL